MLIGNIKHEATITKIKLSCISFVPSSRIQFEIEQRL